MYYEYWGLKKSPFDNVPDPTMYVESHASVENAIAETLFAIEEGNDCLAVIVGEIGLGKTLSLRLILDSLQPDRYKIAFITNPDMSFVQLLREIIGQLTGQQCETKRRSELLEIFNKFLFQTADEGRKTLIFIDEANAISPANLESLRLLTNMQDDERNLFTIVLAGQMELARRLEHPRRANLFQRIGTYTRIDKIGSPDLLQDYVQTRVRLAGGDGRRVFTEDAIPFLWEYSEHGVPRLVNKICKLSLKAGETNGFDAITGSVVQQIGERFQKLTGPATQKRKPRRRPADNSRQEDVERLTIVEHEAFEAGVDLLPQPEVLEKVDVHQTAEKVMVEEMAPVPRPADEPVEPMPESVTPITAQRCDDVPEEICEETWIGNLKIRIEIPQNVVIQARTSTRAQKMKLAGGLAAETLQRYPQLTGPSISDPVSLWNDITNVILSTLEQGESRAAVR
jgi:type II secretory pathway predicted ATPase ExeA